MIYHKDRPNFLHYRHGNRRTQLMRKGYKVRASSKKSSDEIDDWIFANIRQDYTLSFSNHPALGRDHWFADKLEAALFKICCGEG